MEKILKKSSNSVKSNSSSSNPISINSVSCAEMMPSPPLTNRGVDRTIERKNKIIIDWLGLSFPFKEVHKIFPLLQLPFNDFVVMNRGGMFYKSCMRMGNISIYYDGADDMGVHVEMSGKGCREFEAINGFVWPAVFSRIKEYKGKVTRIDIAHDDYRGLMSPEFVHAKIKNYEVKSRFHWGLSYEKLSLSEKRKSESGNTVYIGSKKSDVMFRIYDKGRKEGVKFSWIRLEGQFRNKHADRIAVLIDERFEDFGSTFAAIINNYFTILDKKESDSNKRRWSVNAQWAAFIGSIGRESLLVKDKISKTINDVKSWLLRQVSPSLNMVKMSYGFDRDQYKAFLSLMINEGRARFKTKHQLILQGSI